MSAAIAVRQHVGRCGVSSGHGPKLPEEMTEVYIFRPEIKVVYSLRLPVKLEHIGRIGQGRECGSKIADLRGGEIVELQVRRSKSVEILRNRGRHAVVSRSGSYERVAAIRGTHRGCVFCSGQSHSDPD